MFHLRARVHRRQRQAAARAGAAEQLLVQTLHIAQLLMVELGEAVAPYDGVDLGLRRRARHCGCRTIASGNKERTAQVCTMSRGKDMHVHRTAPHAGRMHAPASCLTAVFPFRSSSGAIIGFQHADKRRQHGASGLSR